LSKINTKPLLSIIIAYFGSLRIKKILNCFLSEKNLNLEIILIDDNPSLIDKKYSLFTKDSRLKVIKNKINIGPTNSFCLGIKFSKGEFILLSSDHDYFEKNSLKKIMKPLIINDKFGASFCNFNVINENRKYITKYYIKKNYFEYFNKRSTFIRILKFYLDPEYMGKANMIYSIFRKKLFDTQKFLIAKKYFGLNQDRLFLFDFLQNNRIFIHKKNFFNVIVHDEDFYKDRRKKQTTIFNYVFQQFSGYIFFSRNLIIKIIITILLPYKLYQLFIRKFFFKL
jgi:glycosyltransferase involved in cell wall biosynthesis